MTFTTMLESYNHDTSIWTKLYEIDPEFTTTYHMLGTNTHVTNFHLQDRLLCHLGHLFLPSREREKLIWESHYSRVEKHFGIENIVAMLQKHFYWPKI
jgi:hypothetical protein